MIAWLKAMLWAFSRFGTGTHDVFCNFICTLISYRADFTKLVCHWPLCSLTIHHQVTFDGKEDLEAHHRKSHKTHDFAWSCILPSTAEISRLRRVPDSTTSAGLELVPVMSGSRSDVSRHRSETVIVVRGSPRREDRTLLQERRVRFSLPDRENQSKFQTAEATVKASVQRPLERHDDERQRFGLLPESQRPEPTAPAPETFVDSGELKEFIAPEPIFPPPIGCSATSDSLPLPNSSLVPSYLLAGSNRFTKAEIHELVPKWGWKPRAHAIAAPQPLFVYGSFMFPSIFRARAAAYTKGRYSPRHQRRLSPDDVDWARASISLKHAAETMTPAILKNYDRWRPRGLSCAVIQDSALTQETLNAIGKEHAAGGFNGEVKGFLTFGLTEEALRCCDDLFGDEPFEDRSGDPDIQAIEKFNFASGLEPPKPPKRNKRRMGSLVRKKVQVDFELKGGESITVEAATFVWNGPPAAGLQGPWNINEFVKGRAFRTWSTGPADWVQEEMQLASKMRITYVLPGDAMSNAVLHGQVGDVKEMLAKGDDPDAPCHGYGTVLQTAAAEGDEDMVQLILSTKVDVNAKGGKYQNALMAATVRGHEGIARLLLDAGAEPLEDGGRYISPLYQAVSHSDEDMTLLLLERGAWLTKGYNEILDLAAERSSEKTVGLLTEYDVRDIHLTLPSFANLIEPSERERAKVLTSQDIAVSSGALLKAIVWQAMVLKGKPGKWTGSKGVQLLKAAIGAGMNPQVIDAVGDHLTSISSLLEYLKDAANERRSSAGQEDHKSIDSTTVRAERRKRAVQAGMGTLFAVWATGMRRTVCLPQYLGRKCSNTHA